MTRWNIRQRLARKVRGSLGELGGVLRPPRQEVERIEVEFVLPDGSVHTVQTEPHYTLHMASQMLSTPIHTPCPDGSCGDCRVKVLAGAEALRPPSAVEAELLARVLGDPPPPDVRLACHARLAGTGARIQVERIWNLEEIRGSAE